MILATTKARILEYLESKGISRSEFYSQTEIKRGLLDTDKLSATVPDTAVAKIIAAFPDLNIVWLITGKGTMLRTQAASESNLIGYLKEKDGKIEELLRENARLKSELEQTSGLSERVARLEAAIDKGGERAGTAKGVVG